MKRTHSIISIGLLTAPLMLSSQVLADGMYKNDDKINQRDQVIIDTTNDEPALATENAPMTYGARDASKPSWELTAFVGYLNTLNSNSSGSLEFRWKEYNTDAPYNLGLRATRWETNARGWQLDYSRSRLQADPATIAARGAADVNLKTINAISLSRVFSFPNGTIFNATPYIAVGAGIDYISAYYRSTSNVSLSDSELGGLNYGAQLGLRRAFGENLIGFLETRFMQHSVSLDWDNIDFNSDIPTIGVNLGVGYRF